MIVNNNKLIVRRADIFMVALTGEIGSQLLRGDHPMLILSCQKSNSSSDLYNAIPLTSTFSDNPSGVVIGEESGLLHPSTILCNQLRVIETRDIKWKIGFVDKFKMDQIMQVLQSQLGVKDDTISIIQKQKLEYMLKTLKEYVDFKKKYNITDAELDMKIDASMQEVKAYCNSLNYEYKNWGNLEMFKVYEEKRNEVRLCKCKKDYKQMEKLCQEYLDNLYSMNYVMYGKDVYSEFEWSLYNLALATKLNGNVEKAYGLAKQALNFTNGDKDNYYAYSCWLVGSCCMEMSDDYKDEGINMFDECIIFYQKIKYVKYEILSIFNKSKLKFDVSSMKECIVRYEKENIKNILFSIGDMQDDEVLMELKSELNSMN